MPPRVRLDAELVRRGLARSRQHAAELIDAGRVLLDGRRASKPATQLRPAQPVRLLEPPEEAGPEYVSRGGHKLAGALDLLGPRAPRVAGQRVLDAGASTGGFVDVLLRRGAAHVLAVDVGYGQLDWGLRTDDRVTVLDRTNVRNLSPEQVGTGPDLITADLSFISLTLVLPSLLQVGAPSVDLLVMVKPQFEVGRERLGSGGVVRDPSLHADAVAGVARTALDLGAHVLAVAPSPLPGPSGNVEYFLFLHRGAGRGPVPDALTGPALTGAIEEAVRSGPAGRLR